MLTQLPYSVPQELMSNAGYDALPTDDFRYTINQPTGSFFYDPWVIKPEHQDTVWGSILQTLPLPIGEARLIVLKPGTGYQSHADIDDRYHLNIIGEQCYMLDFDNQKLHQVATNGNWYEMDAGRIHSAANFGRLDRIQLVIRKLLDNASLADPVAVKLTSTGLSKEDTRYMFDQTVSKWLNYANKQQAISNFEFNHGVVSFSIERNRIDELQSILIKEFKLEML